MIFDIFVELNIYSKTRNKKFHWTYLNVTNQLTFNIHFRMFLKSINKIIQTKRSRQITVHGLRFCVYRAHTFHHFLKYTTIYEFFIFFAAFAVSSFVNSHALRVLFFRYFGLFRIQHLIKTYFTFLFHNAKRKFHFLRKNIFFRWTHLWLHY